MRTRKEGKQNRSGGKPKFLLSGLLVCDVCGAHYVLTDRRSYSCSSFHNGRACSNGVRVRREQAEIVLLDPIRKDLSRRNAFNVWRWTCELRTSNGRVRRPGELQELTARIERLRERLKRGDPHMTPDEIQAAIERAEEKARELQNVASPPMRVFTMLARAAEAYRRQIGLGLEGEPRAALKARSILEGNFRR